MLGGFAAVNVAMWGTLLTWSSTPQHAAQAQQTKTTTSHSIESTGLRTIDNRPTQLPAGPLIVEAFAPWCMYCATTARWDDVSDARWAHEHDLGFVLVDASAAGGVGKAAQAPTLDSIVATAQDGSRVPLATNRAIATNLKRFQATYHLTEPIDFWTHGQASASWHIRAFPTFLYLNAAHQVVSTLSGYHTTAQFTAWAVSVTHNPA